MRTLSSALAITAILACARGQAPPPTAGGWVDPNRQVLGLTAALTVDDVDGNPVGLVPARVQKKGEMIPDAGITISSKKASDGDPNLWSWEFDGYHMKTVGRTTVHNIRDPAWPEVLVLFEKSSTADDMAPIESGELTKVALDAIAQSLKDGSGNLLGYEDIFAAVNDTALAVVSRMGTDATQAIIGILGSDDAQALAGGMDMPADESVIDPLTDAEAADLMAGAPQSSRRLLKKARK